MVLIVSVEKMVALPHVNVYQIISVHHQIVAPNVLLVVNAHLTALVINFDVLIHVEVHAESVHIVRL